MISGNFKRVHHQIRFVGCRLFDRPERVYRLRLLSDACTILPDRSSLQFLRQTESGLKLLGLLTQLFPTFNYSLISIFMASKSIEHRQKLVTMLALIKGLKLCFTALLNLTSQIFQAAITANQFPKKACKIIFS
jgi:hypothetical protein